MASVTPIDRQDRRRGVALPFGMNVRFTTDQRAFLQMIAEEQDVSVSEALRLVVDEAIAQVVEAQRDPESGARRDVFGIIASFTPDPAWEARHGHE